MHLNISKNNAFDKNIWKKLSYKNNTIWKSSIFDVIIKSWYVYVAM